jgi:hypothetical protein
MEKIAQHARASNSKVHDRQPIRPPHSWGVAVTRAACSTPTGRIHTINQSFVVTNGAARLSRRWSPGAPIPLKGEAEPNALSALARHAEAHARAVMNGEATIENPNPARRAWEGKRAA